MSPGTDAVRTPYLTKQRGTRCVPLASSMGKRELDRFLHLAGTQAARAYLDPADPPIHNGTDLLQVWQKAATGHVVRVTDIVS